MTSDPDPSIAPAPSREEVPLRAVTPIPVSRASEPIDAGTSSPPLPAQTPVTALGSQAISAAAATGVSQAVGAVIQILSVVALGRLLTPGDYGLVAMAMPVFAMVGLFQNLGLMQAVSQAPSLSSAQKDGLFWINVAVGFLLAAIVMGAAPLAGLYYNEPRVVGITLAMSGIVALLGFSQQSRALLIRELRFVPLAIVDIGASLIGLAVSVFLALATHSYWAIVLGWAANVSFSVIASIIACGWLPGRPRRGAGIRAMLRFGAGITTYNIIEYAARNVDNILIGHSWGRQQLGMYDRAYRLILMPMILIGSPLSRVMVPLLSRLIEDEARYRKAFVRSLDQMMLIMTPAIAAMVVTAPILLTVLLGQEWVNAGPIFAALCYVAILQLLDSTAGWLLVSQGRVREYMLTGVLNAVVSLIAFVVGLPGGALGVAEAYAWSQLIRTPLIWWVVIRAGPVRLRDLMPPFWRNALIFAVAYAAGQEAFRNASPTLLLRLIETVLASFASAGIAMILLPSSRRVLLETRDMAWVLLDGMRRKRASAAMPWGGA